MGSLMAPLALTFVELPSSILKLSRLAGFRPHTIGVLKYFYLDSVQEFMKDKNLVHLISTKMPLNLSLQIQAQVLNPSSHQNHMLVVPRERKVPRVALS